MKAWGDRDVQGEATVNEGPRERLLATATDMIRERGVAGAGLADLLKSSHTARGSIYQHFPGGKDELVAAAVRQSGDTTRRRIKDLAELGDPAAVIRAIMAATKEALEAETFTRGCPIVAAAVSGPAYPAAVDAAADVFSGWVSELGDVLIAVGVPAHAAEALASLTISSFEGALIQARSTRSPAPLDAAAEQLAALAGGYNSTS